MARVRTALRRSTPLLILAPSLIATLVFVYLFIAWTFRVSMTSWSGLTPVFDFVGLQNYIDLFADRRFQIDIRNQILFTVPFVGGSMALGLLLAILVDQRIRAEALFRTVYLFPMAVSFIVTGVVWRWLMNPAMGDRATGLNLLFDMFGLTALQNRWYATPDVGMIAIALPAVWQMSGYTMALFLAGLRGIPEELREAARVDGASSWQLYRHVILPLLRPVTLTALVIIGHISLKVFDLIIAVAGKQIQLDVPAINMWQTTFDANDYGHGAAIAILIFLSVAVVLIPYLWSTLRSEVKQ
jgi:glucose/mannose transport system permease protein